MSRRCTFPLESLFTDRRLRLDSWFMRHQSLKSVALYSARFYTSSTFPNVPSRSLRQIRAFQLCGFYGNAPGDRTKPDNIELYPVLSTVDEAGGIKWTADAARTMADRLSFTGYLKRFSVFLRTTSHGQNLKRVLGSIASNFGTVHELALHLEENELHFVSFLNNLTSSQLIKTPTQDNCAFAETLGEMKNLRHISIYFWDDSVSHSIRRDFQDKAVQLAEHWTANSPKVLRIMLPDRSCAVREKGGPWHFQGRGF